VSFSSGDMSHYQAHQNEIRLQTSVLLFTNNYIMLLSPRFVLSASAFGSPDILREPNSIVVLLFISD
jgi:hypothetical protein